MDLKTLTHAAAGKEAVLMDLDNTLYPYAPCHEAGLKEAHPLFNEAAPCTFKHFLLHYDRAREQIKVHTRLQAASHSRVLYFQKMVEDNLERTRFTLIRRLEAAYWRGYFRSMKLFPWVLPFLDTLKKEGKKTCLITDLTCDIQIRKIIKLGLQNRIDFLVSSEEAGIEKPHPRIFQLALAKLWCKPEQVLGIGEDPERDYYRRIQFIRV